MSRCVGSVLLLSGICAWCGCAEESLDVPIIVPDDLNVSAENTKPNSAETVQPEPWFIDDPHASQDSAATSVWNALLYGTAAAIDEGEAEKNGAPVR